jgi:hypothetical protein
MCKVRSDILDNMEAQLTQMQQDLAAFREGEAGCGFAWLPPRNYEDRVMELAKHDGTNGHTSNCPMHCGGAREGL